MKIKWRGGVVLLLVLSIGIFCINLSYGGKTMEKLTGKKVVMIIAEKDFRDEELLEPKKILEDEGASVTVASTTSRTATGMFGAKATPDILVSEVKVDEYDAIIFVGGAGASQYWNDSTAHSIAREAVQKNKILCAICIAPVTLANAGVLSGKKATVWVSERRKLETKGASYTGKPVEIAGKIITASGPEAAEEFGRSIARALASSTQPS